MANEPFIWTEEMVKELVAEAHRHGSHREPLGIYDRIQNYKQSKIKEKKRIEVIGMNILMTEGRGKDCHFYTNGDVPKEKVPAIKQAIESILNDEPIEGGWLDNHMKECTKKFKEAEDKFYSQLVNTQPIEEVIVSGKDWYIAGTETGSSRISSTNKILAVKRISDNQMFWVGNEVEYRAGDDDKWETCWDAKIQAFNIVQGELVIELNDGNEWNDRHYPNKFIQNIRHKPKEDSRLKNSPMGAFSGEYVTKEECERREQAAWDFAREKYVIDGNPFNKQYRFLSFGQYKYHSNREKELYEKNKQPK